MFQGKIANVLRLPHMIVIWQCVYIHIRAVVKKKKKKVAFILPDPLKAEVLDWVNLACLETNDLSLDYEIIGNFKALGKYSTLSWTSMSLLSFSLHL